MSATNREGGGGRVTGRVGSGQALRGSGRVGSGQIIGSCRRVGSGRVQTLAGRVGSEKLDPGTTLAGPAVSHNIEELSNSAHSTASYHLPMLV